MVDRGTIVLVELDPTVGHDQRSLRPCVAVSDPSVNEDQRFPLIAVIPVTGTPGVSYIPLSRPCSMHASSDTDTCPKIRRIQRLSIERM